MGHRLRLARRADSVSEAAAAVASSTSERATLAIGISCIGHAGIAGRVEVDPRTSPARGSDPAESGSSLESWVRTGRRSVGSTGWMALSGAQLRHAPFASFQQLSQAYWRHVMQKLKVLWNCSVTRDDSLLCRSFRAYSIASPMEAELLRTKYLSPFARTLASLRDEPADGDEPKVYRVPQRSQYEAA